VAELVSGIDLAVRSQEEAHKRPGTDLVILEIFLIKKIVDFD
jgi:hypothetical protein